MSPLPGGLSWLLCQSQDPCFTSYYTTLFSLCRTYFFVYLCFICLSPGSSIQGIFQARILEWVTISFSRGSSQPRDQTQVSHVAGRLFTVWATREALQFSLVAQSCLTLCDPMNRSTPGLPVHHQLPEFTQIYVHQALRKMEISSFSVSCYLVQDLAPGHLMEA